MQLLRYGKGSVALCALALIGCKPPQRDPQVVAVLDGLELTRRDVAAEQAMGPESERELIDRIIDRQILADEAVHRGANLDPRYLAALRRSKNELLVATLTRRLSEQLPTPTDAQLRQFSNSHVWLFDQREIFTLSLVANAQHDRLRSIDSLALNRDQWVALKQSPEAVTIDGLQYRVIERVAKPLKAEGDRKRTIELWRAVKTEETLAGIIARGRSVGALEYLTKLE